MKNIVLLVLACCLILILLCLIIKSVKKDRLLTRMINHEKRFIKFMQINNEALSGNK